MGYYINPRSGTKEEFLRKEGLEILGPEWPKDDAYALVVLVDNGPFRAAGICYSKQERDAFAYPGDDRPKRWFLVKKQRLVDEGFIEAAMFEDGAPEGRA